MEIFTMVLSSIAIIISIVTFWLSNIYDPKRIYIVRTEDIGNINNTIEIAVINNRKSDIFVTSIEPYLEIQGKLTIGQSSTATIESGKIYNFVLQNHYNIDSLPVESGKKTEAGYMLDLNIYITWVDKSGVKKSSIIEYYKLHYNNEKKFIQKTFLPLSKETNLYKKTSNRY